MAWISTILTLTALVFLLQAWLSKRKIKANELPPGPKGLPLIGSLHLLGKFPHRALNQLAKRYGPIMYMKLGLVPTVVVSSPQAAELFLKTHDSVFASRPLNEASKHISYGQQGLSFSKYGSYWRNIRKMCTLELLSNLKVNSFMSMRKEELNLLIENVKDASRNHAAVDLSAKVSSLSAGISCRMIFGKKYMDEDFDDKGFGPLIKEGMHLIGIFNLGDYIPPIAPLDLQGLTKRMKAVGKANDNFLEKVIDEHIQFKDENRTKDFVDVMLEFLGSEEAEYRIGRDNIKAIMMDMLAASMDTSSTVIEWALSELIKHPRTMKKLQQELEEKIGMDRMVEESELESLDYLNMVIKETFRLHPVAPLLLPHESMEDCIIDGFLIPKRTRLIINAWAIGHDGSVWTDADKFFPERFLESNIDVRGHDFQLIPFGSGRRICPGIQLGLTMVRITVAQLVHCFDWELPDNMAPDELDMSEAFGLVSPRAKHLCAIPTHRLCL